MAGPIFDTHAHYLSRQFDPDRRETLAGLPGQGVTGVVECATDYVTSVAALELARRIPWMWAALGVHPESLIQSDASTLYQFKGDWQAELAAIRPLYEDEKAVAVGECGLDHHWPVPKDAQLALFEAEIKTALELDKPIIVHDREAHAETYALLKRYRPKGVVHCFSGSAEDALALVKQGLYIGLGGAVTFKGAKRSAKVIQALPLEFLVLETDCPYQAPEPCRGRRCHSGLITYTGAFIAALKGISEQQLFAVTEQNARRLFAL